MKLANREKGFALIELIMALAVGGIMMSVLVTTIFQTTTMTSKAAASINSMRDIHHVAQSVVSYVRMAQISDPAVEQAKDNLTLDWVIWDDSTGDLIATNYHCEYTFLNTEGKVQRAYWEDYNPAIQVLPTKLAPLATTSPISSTLATMCPAAAPISKWSSPLPQKAKCRQRSV